MIQRKWELSPTKTNTEACRALADTLGLLYPTAALLWQRGVCSEADAKRFLSGGEDALYNPFLMRDMDKAVTRILQAVQNGEKITVFGDYDVDGITSVTVLYSYLKEELGATVAYYIPERLAEGYGMNTIATERIVADGTKLVVTVDNGITACDEVEAFRAAGVDVVVTDHHTCRDVLPQAVAVVDPHRPDCDYPFPMLAGVGVVFKLICAIAQTRAAETKDADFLRPLCEKYLDLVALGTIADVMPLVEENRLIVRVGLAAMEKHTRPGIAALLACCRREKRGAARKLNASYLGFTIAPRINAAGRLASASLGAELFLSEDRTRTMELAEELCRLNSERQAAESELMAAAQAQIPTTCDFAKDNVLVLAGAGWHPGVIGIVASRLAERYGMPTILISIGEDGIGKGSGRSPEYMNLVHALAACEGDLIQFGGHALAAGLTIEAENIEAFRAHINDYARDAVDTEARVQPMQVDLALRPLDLTLRQAQELSLLEPFGTANPTPLFVLEAATLREVKAIGNGKHCRLSLLKNAIEVQAVCFGKSPEELIFTAGDTVDAVFALDCNSYQGKESVQLNVRALFVPVDAQAENDRQDAQFADLATVAKTTSGLLPNRTELSGVYMCLSHLAKSGRTAVSLYELQKTCVPYLSRLKLRIALAIFTESGLLTLDPLRGMSDLSYTFALQASDTKRDLTATPTYRLVAQG